LIAASIAFSPSRIVFSSLAKHILKYPLHSNSLPAKVVVQPRVALPSPAAEAATAAAALSVVPPSTEEKSPIKAIRCSPRIMVLLPLLNTQKATEAHLKLRLIRQRFVSFLRVWIERWWMVDFQSNTPLVMSILNFVKEKLNEYLVIFKILVVEHSAPKAETKNHLVSSLALRSTNKNVSVQSTPFSKLSASDIAEQLTVIEAEYFQQLHPIDLLSQVLKTGKTSGNSDPSPNLTKIICRFNQVSLWVATSIVTAPNEKIQVKTIKQFIRVSKKLSALRNFNSVMAVLSGLNMSSVARLPAMKEALPANYKEELTKLEEMMSPAQNFKGYRSLEKLPPTLPYLAVCLRDLTYINDGNNDYLKDEILNLEKMRLFNETMNTFFMLGQSHRYYLPHKPQVKNVLLNITWLDENDLHRYSRERSASASLPERRRSLCALTESSLLK